LEKLLENKLRSLKDDPQVRLKLLRFALGRGYQYDQVKSVVDSLWEKSKENG
jgi:regulatory protein